MDNHLTIGLRRNMIEDLGSQLTSLGYKDFEKILDVMQAIPRHALAPIGFETIAYEINPVLIDEDQTMSSPLTVAIQTLLLHPQPTDKILEIGTGSGYQASVLSSLCHSIYTLERHKILHEKAKIFFKKMNFRNIYPQLKDGFEGLASQAPFDKIIITCGADHIPEKLLDQLKINGEMLIPLHDGKAHAMKRIIKLAEKEYFEEDYGDFKFVPMLSGIVKQDLTKSEVKLDKNFLYL